MPRRPLAAIVVSLSFPVVLGWCPPTAEAERPSATGQPTRVLQLELQPTGRSWIRVGQAWKGPPTAVVKFYNNPDDAIFFSVRGLRQLADDGAYALHVTTGTSPDDYVEGAPGNARMLFNTDWNGVHSVWVFQPRDIPVHAEPLTAFVTLDPDDGEAHDTMPDASRIIFQGTSLAPTPPGR